MDECPHCGEPIEDEAVRCPHCGSDTETGWNPEKDSYSFELPDDDLETEEDGSTRSGSLRWPVVTAAVIVALSTVGFFWSFSGVRGRTALYALLAVAVVALGIWAAPRSPSPPP